MSARLPSGEVSTWYSAELSVNSASSVRKRDPLLLAVDRPLDARVIRPPDDLVGDVDDASSSRRRFGDELRLRDAFDELVVVIDVDEDLVELVPGRVHQRHEVHVDRAVGVLLDVFSRRKFSPCAQSNSVRAQPARRKARVLPIARASWTPPFRTPRTVDPRGRPRLTALLLTLDRRAIKGRAPRRAPPHLPFAV
jgi:hypothetical protein